MNTRIDKTILGYYICRNQIAWQKWDGLIEVTHGGVQVTIKRPDIVGNVGNNDGNNDGNVAVMQLTERQRRICHQIAAVADITAKQMAVMLDIPTRTLERELSSLQQRGVIRHEGKARTGHWVVLIKL